MALNNPPSYLQAGSHPASQDRRMIRLMAQDNAGVLGATDFDNYLTTTELRITPTAPIPSMQVVVDAGRVIIPGTETTGSEQGYYYCDAPSETTVTIPASDPTNTTYYGIWAYVRDSEYSGTSDDWGITVLADPDPTQQPDAMAPENSWMLAVVTVPAGATSISNVDITDRRLVWAPLPARLLNASVDTAQLAADAVTGAKLADDAVNSEHIANGAIDAVHLAADVVDGSKIADNSINSEHYVDGSIDRVHLAADVIDGTKLADNAVNSEHYTDRSIDAVHIATGAITANELATNSVGNDEMIDSPTFTTVTATSMTLGGTDLGEVVTFTPTWTNASGFESNVGWYARIKDLIWISVQAEFNSSVSITGDVRLDLPVSAAGGSHAASNGMLSVQLFDFDGFVFYAGMGIPVDSDTVSVRYNIVSGAASFGQPLSSTAPHTWADGDKILINGMYRVGS
jgi:hypothetical protein